MTASLGRRTTAIRIGEINNERRKLGRERTSAAVRKSGVELMGDSRPFGRIPPPGISNVPLQSELSRAFNVDQDARPSGRATPT